MLFGAEGIRINGEATVSGAKLTPAAIHYAIVREENFLRNDKELEDELNKYLKNLTPSRWALPERSPIQPPAYSNASSHQFRPSS